MRATRFEARKDETVAVRLFLWAGLLTTMACTALAALTVARPLLF
jgi:hypothetical protein